ncbi:MAG TPA: type IV pilus secretin PilQ, partial [Nitrospinota bacterium]|nr:type IV pilus secretin PilQ [Nitrospinota bacterium]
ATEVTKASFVTNVKPEMLGDRSRIHIKTTGPIQYTAFKLSDPLRLILDISDMEPKPEAQEPIEFNKGAINRVSTHYFPESNITRVIIGLNQKVPHDITKFGDNELNIDIDLPQETQIKAVSMETPEEPLVEPVKDEILPEEPEIEEKEVVQKEEKKFTGQLISLDFQNAKLKNILRLIAGVSGFNIITSPEVKGAVTLRLMEVPWDQALDLILKNNKLGMQKKGNIIRITTMKRLTEEKKAEISAITMEQQSKKSKETTEELISKTVPISYADMAALTGILDGVKSARGDIQVDDRTSTIIIHDIQSSIDEMMRLIKILDKRTKQVSIEARIVEVNTAFSKDLGIQWGGNFSKTTNKIFPNTVQLRGGLTGGSVGGSVTSDNFIVDLPAAAGSGSGAAIGMSLGSLTGAVMLDVRLSALESSGHGKILSSPRITTANHKQAKIKSGRSIPYETVSSEGTQTQFVAADISLDVTSHITPDGFIRLEINATKNAADFGNTGASGAPTILTKEAQTEVLVQDGATTVLGGLYQTSKTTSDAGVPFLSKVPFLKWLFKNEAKTESTEELLIFITPKIVGEN